MIKELIIFIILTGALIASGCTTTSDNQTSAPTPDQTSVSTNNTSDSSGSTSTVDIKNFAFNPATTTISVGDTVQWTNSDSVGHRVHGNGFDSSEMPVGSMYNYTFTQAGTYNYTCTIHPSMQGQVIVQ